MSILVPTARTADTLPAAEALATWSTVPGEELVYDLPSLHSWLVAGAPDGAGNYFDRGQRGNNWLQATVGSQPPVTANWLSTGRPAWTFDGATAYNLVANFTAPVGDWSAAVVCSLDPATSTGDGKFRTLLTSTLAPINQYGACQSNRAPGLYTTGRSYNKFGSVLTVSAPHLLVFAWSAADQALSLYVDGGAAQTLSLSPNTYTGTLQDITCMMGAANNATYSPWFGGIAEVALFSKSLGSANSASDLALVTSVLRAKYGI